MKLRVLFTGIMMLMISLAFAQDEASYTPDLTDGENLYKTRCTACHKLDARLVGPALEGIAEKRSVEWLVGFIRNSTEMIEAGDEEAVAIFEEFSKMPMIPNLDLSDDQIKNIIAYIDPSAFEAPAEEVATEGEVVEDVAEEAVVEETVVEETVKVEEKVVRTRGNAMNWPPLATGIVVALMLILLLLLLYFTTTLKSIMKDRM